MSQLETITLEVDAETARRYREADAADRARAAAAVQRTLSPGESMRELAIQLHMAARAKGMTDADVEAMEEDLRQFS